MSEASKHKKAESVSAGVVRKCLPDKKELASADQDSPEAVGRKLSKHFTTDYRDLVLKATAVLRAATKLGIACADGQIPLVESLVSSSVATNKENSSKQQTAPAASAGDAQTSTAESSCSATDSGVASQSVSSPLATAVLASPEPEFASYRFKFKLLSGMRSILVEDYLQVCHWQRLPRLPEEEPCVAQIILAFANEKRYLLSRSERELGTHIDLRLLQIFDARIQTMMYGPSEVDQLRLLQRQPKFRPCHYYGFVHLLRFLILLPKLLSRLPGTPSNDGVLESLDPILKVLIKFVQANMKKLSRGVRYGARDAVLSALSGTGAQSGDDAKGNEDQGTQESKGVQRRRSRDVGSERATANSTRKKAKT